MRKQITALVAACCLLSAGAAGAEELREMQGGSIAIGAIMGSVYYTDQDGDYRVVATLSTASDNTPVRVVARLRPGQMITLSVPGFAGAPEQSVSLTRTNNRLMISNGGARSVATN
jgi:hypothetical protein